MYSHIWFPDDLIVDEHLQPSGTAYISTCIKLIKYI